MRCFCIIHRRCSGRTGIRPEHPAGCNEKSPSVARGSTYFRERSLLPPSLSLPPPPASCPSSSPDLNLRVSETGRAVPEGESSASPPIRPAFLFLTHPPLPRTWLAFRCLLYLLFFFSYRRSLCVNHRANSTAARAMFLQLKIL